MKYMMVYWLRNQSRLFGEPQCYATNDAEAFARALMTAQREGYEVEYIKTPSAVVHHEGGAMA